MHKIHCFIMLFLISTNFIVAESITTKSIYKVWGTYLGGSKYDETGDLKQNSDGNLIIVGNTESSDIQISENAYQKKLKGTSNIILYSFDKDGAFLWNTYFGDSLTYCSKLLLDDDDNIYLIGATKDKQLPANNTYQTSYGGGATDAIIIKFDKFGNFINCSYFGGEGEEEITSANIDSEGNIVIGGNTTSKNNIASNEAFQTNNGGFKDIFIAKFNKELNTRIWSSYYGGEKDEYLYDFTMADNGDIVITLSTNSTKIKISENAFQKILDIDNKNPFSRIPIIARFTNNGGFVYSTYFGKTYIDFRSISSFGNDEFICIGFNDYFQFVSDDAYNKNNTGGDPYILRFKLKDSFVPTYASYLNFPDLLKGTKVVADKSGNYTILGIINGRSDSTAYLDFTTSNAIQRTGVGGYTDCFIAKFSNNNQPFYITLIGGDSTDLSRTILYDNNDSCLYFAGLTQSKKNIATKSSYRDTPYLYEDIFVIKFKETTITSVLDNMYKDNLSFPNPARSTTRLNLQHEGQAEITAVDMLGRSFPLWSGLASAGEMELDVSNLPTGSYTLLVNYGTKIDVVRMIKE